MATLLAGCGSSGSVALTFDVPDDAALRPTNATKLTLIAQVGEDAPRATTATINGDGTVDLGDLPVAGEVWLSAEMRTDQEDLAGFGRAPGAVAISATDVTHVTLPVRRPFVYLAGAGTHLVSCDASVAPTSSYQGQVGTTGAAVVIADVAGTDIATIAANGSLTYVSSATHGASTLAPVSLGFAPKDAVATPDGKYLVVGGTGKLAVVDVMADSVATASVPGSADRVAVTRGSDGAWWGVAAIGRAMVDTGCTPSQLASFPLGDPTAAQLVNAGLGVSDVAGDPRTGKILVGDRCGNRVLGFDPVAGALDKGDAIMNITSPTALAASDGRVWAVGHSLQRSSSSNVPDGIVDAWLVLGSADLVAGGGSVDNLPPLVERVLATDANFPDQDIAQDLHANGVVADRLVVMAGGEHLAITLSAVLAGDQLVDSGNNVVIPSLAMTTEEYWLLDASNRTPTQRVRTDCSLVVGQCDPFFCILGNWRCQDDIDKSAVDFTPTGVTALFGAR